MPRPETMVCGGDGRPPWVCGSSIAVHGGGAGGPGSPVTAMVSMASMATVTTDSSLDRGSSGTTDLEHGTGGVAGRAAAEEPGRFGDLLGAAQPAERDGRAQALWTIGHPVGCVQAGLDQAGSDGV